MEQPQHIRLTPREHEVLRCLEQGMTNRQIAAVLVITVFTVQNHLCSIFDKLDVCNRTMAVLVAQRLGYCGRAEIADSIDVSAQAAGYADITAAP